MSHPTAFRPHSLSPILTVILLLVSGLLTACADRHPQEPSPPFDEEPPSGEIRFSDIAIAYHGLLLNEDLEIIELDKAVLEGLQDSMIESLTAAPVLEDGEAVYGQERKLYEGSSLMDPSYANEVLSGFEFTEDERIVVKSALIQKVLDSVSEQERSDYQWHFDLLREKAFHYVDPKTANPRAELAQRLEELELVAAFDRLWAWRAQGVEPYIEVCQRVDVPIPPEWPAGKDASGIGWKMRGQLPFLYNFLQSGTNTEVWTYQTDQGLCYALPRKNKNKETNKTWTSLVGIICQSLDTGNACFWDNIDASTGKRIAGETITLNVADLKNGSNLAENCTACHRGSNAFLVHPKTPLGAPSNRTPSVRYSPIGQATWSNPPPMFALGAGPCAGCHEIGAAAVNEYCRVLRLATDSTMPDSSSPAGWASPKPPYDAQILSIKKLCGFVLIGGIQPPQAHPSLP